MKDAVLVSQRSDIEMGYQHFSGTPTLHLSSLLGKSQAITIFVFENGLKNMFKSGFYHGHAH